MHACMHRERESSPAKGSGDESRAAAGLKVAAAARVGGIGRAHQGPRARVASRKCAPVLYCRRAGNEESAAGKKGPPLAAAAAALAALEIVWPQGVRVWMRLWCSIASRRERVHFIHARVLRWECAFFGLMGV